MKKRLSAIHLLFPFLVIGILHLPLAFASSAAGNKLFMLPPADNSVRAAAVTGTHPAPKSVYDSLHLNLKGLSKEAYEYARMGMERLASEGKLLNTSILSIIDFSLPSHKKRLFVIDLKNYKILFNTLVAHGRNTGRETASSFSNQNSSYKSSPGFFITGETYQGKNGYSLKLEGMERGINDNAYNRGIVIHGAGYVSEAFVHTQGYIGRSQGCPAVPVHLNKPIINTIKEGTCLFIFHPSYINSSALLH